MKATFANTPSEIRTAPTTKPTFYSDMLTNLVDAGVRTKEDLYFFMENQNADLKVYEQPLVGPRGLESEMKIVDFIHKYREAIRSSKYFFVEVSSNVFDSTPGNPSKGPIAIPGFTLKWDNIRRAFIALKSTEIGHIGFSVEKSPLRTLYNKIGFLITGSI